MKYLLFLSSFFLLKVSAQTFSKTEKGCVDGSPSTPDCPQKYEFVGGPGWVGHRLDWPVTMYCSPSCNDASNPKECSLILAMHGIYSNPGDQTWLMMGQAVDPTSDTFNEDPSVGGPYCISFHKSKSDAWEYKCGGDDEAHLEAFIHYALDNFPIDPDAVNLHGFSSGAIQTNQMMNTRCSIEKLISAAAPYGAGHVGTPPTTKAAFLVAHGTHDEIVPYEDKWSDVFQTDVPSCQCIKLTDTGCTNKGFVHLQGESLAGSIATLRGYTGDLWEDTPSPSSQLDLINEDTARCNQVLSECTSILEYPNPWNEGLSCDNVPTMETDVINYPVSNDYGPVTLLRMNLHNHDYPNKRRHQDYGAGPAEFFIQLRMFFYNNRGRQTYPGTRSIQEVSTGTLCSNPTWITYSSPDVFYRPILYKQNLSKDECKEMCLEEKRCEEAFYVNFGSNRACVMHTDLQPCLSFENAFWADAVHWKAKTILFPTASPTYAPTRSPIISDAPTSHPTLSPTTTPDSFCLQSQTLNAGFQVSYTCLINGFSIGDFLDGSTTSESCASMGGEWVPYSCQNALDFWKGIPDRGVRDHLANEWYRSRCCIDNGTLPPTIAPSKVTSLPTGSLTSSPTASQTSSPTSSPTSLPTSSPTALPSSLPTSSPTALPTSSPTSSPTALPTSSPTTLPTASPTSSPTSSPTVTPQAGFQGPLWPGDQLSSPNGNIQLVFEENGNLVLYDKSSNPLWSTDTEGIDPWAVGMQRDGNLVLYDMDRTPQFSTKTNGNPGASLYVQDDGNLVIKDASGTPIWDRIQGKKGGFQGSLRPGDFLRSPNGKIELTLEQNGNLVLKDETSNSLWSTHTEGIDPWALGMQRDGNMVLYDMDRKPQFSTKTAGNPGALLYVENDGNLVIKDTSGTPIWDRIQGKI